VRRQYAADLLATSAFEQRVAFDPAEASEQEQALLERYMAAHARADAGAVVELLPEDVRFTMPPQPTLFGDNTLSWILFVPVALLIAFVSRGHGIQTAGWIIAAAAVTLAGLLGRVAGHEAATAHQDLPKAGER
jgi:hypothetical protein